MHTMHANRIGIGLHQLVDLVFSVLELSSMPRALNSPRQKVWVQSDQDQYHKALRGVKKAQYVKVIRVILQHDIYGYVSCG